MDKSHPSKVWKVAEASFIEVTLEHPSDRQIRIEFNNGVRLVIAHESQFALAGALINFIRRSEEVSS